MNNYFYNFVVFYSVGSLQIIVFKSIKSRAVTISENIGPVASLLNHEKRTLL